ncbi:MAG: hypothetical protein R2857_15545 [Vampirovibrionales bacterium]
MTLDLLQRQYNDDGDTSSFSAYYSPAYGVPTPTPAVTDVSSPATGNQTLNISASQADQYFDRLYNNTRNPLAGRPWGEDGVNQANIQSELDRLTLVRRLLTPDEQQYVQYLYTLKSNYEEIADDFVYFPPGTAGQPLRPSLQSRPTGPSTMTTAMPATLPAGTAATTFLYADPDPHANPHHQSLRRGQQLVTTRFIGQCQQGRPTLRSPPPRSHPGMGWRHRCGLPRPKSPRPTSASASTPWKTTACSVQPCRRGISTSSGPGCQLY